MRRLVRAQACQEPDFRSRGTDSKGFVTGLELPLTIEDISSVPDIAFYVSQGKRNRDQTGWVNPIASCDREALETAGDQLEFGPTVRQSKVALSGIEPGTGVCGLGNSPTSQLFRTV